MKTYPVERISRKTFDALPEYSLTLPSLTTIGKVWKANRAMTWAGRTGPDDWLICEFVSHPDPNLVGIDYRRPEIIE